MLTFMFASYELMRISYNCYIKAYIVNVLKQKYGTVDVLRTRGQVEHPLKLLSDQIDSNALIDSTFIQTAMKFLYRERLDQPR